MIQWKPRYAPPPVRGKMYSARWVSRGYTPSGLPSVKGGFASEAGALNFVEHKKREGNPVSSSVHLSEKGDWIGEVVFKA